MDDLVIVWIERPLKSNLLYLKSSEKRKNINAVIANMYNYYMESKKQK